LEDVDVMVLVDPSSGSLNDEVELLEELESELLSLVSPLLESELSSLEEEEELLELPPLPPEPLPALLWCEELDEGLSVLFPEAKRIFSLFFPFIPENACPK
jgi:hypothetical protein